MIERAVRAGSLVPPSGGLFNAALGLMVVLLLTISALALTQLGWQYGETGGSALEKMHPGTLVAFGLLVMSALVRGNPMRAFGEALAAHPIVALYLLAVGLLMMHAIFIAGTPFTMFIDTFILPAVVFLLLRDIDDKRGRTLALLIHALFFLNALIGIAEFAGGFRLTALYIEGQVLEDEWRSSALLGHPLSNAMLTGTYMAVLLTGGMKDLPQWVRPIVFLMSAAGMVVFGGRAASAFIVLLIVMVGIGRFVNVLRGARFDPRMVLAGLIGVPILIGLIMTLGEAGFFEKFITRLTDDEGSASTRVEMFALFKHISWPDLIFGPDAAQIQTLMRHYGLDYGIESFWINMILSHGLIASCMFFPALLLFCWEVFKAAPGSLAAIVYFFAVASASLSLSAKTPSLAILVMIVLVLLRTSRTAARTDAAFDEEPGRGAALVA